MKARVNSSGQTVLKYSIGTRLIPVIGVGFLVGLGVSTYFFDVPHLSDPQDWPILLILISPFLGLALNFNLSWFGLDANGIEWHNPVRRKMRIEWAQVESIRGVLGGVKIIGNGRKISVSLVNDMPTLSAFIAEKVPIDRRPSWLTQSVPSPTKEGLKKAGRGKIRRGLTMILIGAAIVALIYFTITPSDPSIAGVLAFIPGLLIAYGFIFFLIGIADTWTSRSSQPMTAKAYNKRLGIVLGGALAMIIAAALVGMFWTGGLHNDEVSLHISNTTEYHDLPPTPGMTYLLVNGTISVNQSYGGGTLTLEPSMFELRTSNGTAYRFDSRLPLSLPSGASEGSPANFTIGFDVPIREAPSQLVLYWGVYHSTCAWPTT
jgi:hypothetical protein